MCNSAGLAFGECSAAVGLTPCRCTDLLCTDLLCVVCIGLVSAECSAVNIGLGRPMFWKAKVLNQYLETRILTEDEMTMKEWDTDCIL